MKREEIQGLFLQGIDCSQVVAGAFAKRTRVDRDRMRRITACFGGGMLCGETCGAVTGALVVIGMIHGHSKEGDQKQKERMMQKMTEFRKLFLEKYPSCMCRELLGHDISKPGEMEKIQEKGLLLEFCPKVVEDTITILENIL